MTSRPDKWDLEVDFITIGSGGGSITAAIVAHDLGKKTVVLEKAPKLGGVSGYSGAASLAGPCSQSLMSQIVQNSAQVVNPSLCSSPIIVGS